MLDSTLKYIIFDFDGTIVDSMTFLENNAVFLLTKYYALSEQDAQRKYRETTGLPFVQQMKIISPNMSKLNFKVVDLFEKMKIEQIHEQKLFQDSNVVLNELKQRGYNLGISSGTIESIIIEYLQRVEISFVNDILGWKEGFEKGEDHFNFIKTKYNLNSADIIFIGDSLNDARRALANNIQFIGKLGMFQKKDFQKIIPDVKVISMLSEILPYFIPQTR
ncbi:MAG: HAD family hydrolase [Candidatus Hodarchaeales archaeon]|jgi:phosphoglycolate phosphatase